MPGRYTPPDSHSHLPASSQRELFPGAVLTGLLYRQWLHLRFAKTKATLPWPKFLMISPLLKRDEKINGAMQKPPSALRQYAHPRVRR